MKKKKLTKIALVRVIQHRKRKCLPDHHILREGQASSSGELRVGITSWGAADFHQQRKECTQQVLL